MNFTIPGTLADSAQNKEETSTKDTSPGYTVVEEDNLDFNNDTETGSSFLDTEEGELEDDDAPPFSLVDTGGERINIKEASAWLQARGLTFDQSKQVIKMFGNGLDANIAGAFHQGLIYLKENAVHGTEYHEAFHAVFRMFLTDAQQDQILKEAGKVTAEELNQREEEGYFTKKDGKIFKKTIRGEKEISKEDLERMILEERLAEQFRGYVLSNQKPKGLLSRIAKFFKDLFNYMTTYISKGRTIDQLFSNIESGKINRKYVNQRYKQGDAFSLVKGFTTTEQEEILNSINSEFTRIYESITSSGQRINPNKVYLNIKNTFLKGMFLQEDNGIVSNPDLEVAKKHYDLLSQGTKVFNKGKDSNIKVAKKWKLFGSIYKRWNTKLTKDEFENISEEGFGFEYLAKRQLSKWGITVVGDLTTEIEDDVFDERIYNRNYAEESRKES
jgi:hypothetical protein